MLYFNIRNAIRNDILRYRSDIRNDILRYRSDILLYIEI